MKRLTLARLVAFGIFGCLVTPAWPQQGQEDLTQRSLVDLMNLEVTSVSKKEEKVWKASSAIFVITQEDILQSSATNIPDLLRMVPGVDIAQISSNKWAISVRGFTGEFSNKLLVLIDGRSVYSPIMSGVFWDEQDVPLDSIDRIEVIRGPGATVWGANAVNGVINVITKKAIETQGGRLTTAAGNYEKGSGIARYGGRFGKNLTYRMTADGFGYGHYPDAEGRSGQDDWKLVHGGFRIDAKPSARDSLLVEGDARTGNAGVVSTVVTSIMPATNATLTFNDRYSGWDMLSRWNHASSVRSETSLQVYFDRSTRGDGTYGLGLDTVDLDFNHHVKWGPRQDIVWGVGYRATFDKVPTKQRISMGPALQSRQLFSSFVQDEISILPDRLFLSLGSKLEHNYYTGFCLQPSVRISWLASDRHMFWASVSQADRTPARSDTSVRVNYVALPGPQGLSILVSLFGNPKFKNEALLATEVGHRVQFNRFSLDGTVFFNHYSDLLSLESGTPYVEADPSPVHVVLPTHFANLEYGETHGLEVLAKCKVASHWNLSSGYSFLTMHILRNALTTDLTTAPDTEGGTPNQQAQLRSHVDLPSRWGWNAAAYFVGPLPSQSVASYTRLDTNVSKQITEGFSLSVAGENLLRDRHLEYAGKGSSVLSSLSKRSAYAKLTWQF